MTRLARPAALLVEALIAVALFGCIPVLVRFVDANPWTIGIVRLAIATAGLAVLLRFRGELRRPSGGDALRLALIGAVFFAHWATYFFAIKISSASIGAIGLSTYGAHLLVLGAIAGLGRLHAVDLLSLGAVLAGAVIIVPEPDLSNRTTAGLALAILSAILYAILPILHQRWSHLGSGTRALGQFSVALALFLLFLPKANWDLGARDWAGLAFLAIGSTLIAHTLWVRVTTRLSPSASSLLYYGNLPVALALSALVLGERLSSRMLLGAVLIVAGSAGGLASQWKRRAFEATRAPR